MKNLSPHVELVNQIVCNAHNAGVVQIKIQDSKVDGKTVMVNGKEKVYFGNCSYLGLELDERIKDAAIEAIRNYGTYFSCSRTYVEIPLFEELEYLFFQMFGKPCTVAPTTTLGHMSNIPTLIRPQDAVIMDHQVHASIQSAVQIVKANGTYVEIMRHGRMDMLESRINKLKDKYDRIWYMTDGVYSMYGDVAPVTELHELMDKYEQLWCYVDDAHGMSWAGENGTGYVLSKMPNFHERLILILSLAKGFGVCGAVMVYPNREIREIVKNCGSTLVFSGPPQPVTLGASIASCHIHLSNEIYDRQAKLVDLMRYYVITAKGLGLPLVSDSKTPIFFVGVGTPDTGYEISKRMLDSGFLLNLSAFPAVPYKNTGLRSTLTINHTVQDIYDMLSTLANHLEDMEKKKKVSKQEIYKAFALSH